MATFTPPVVLAGFTSPETIGTDVKSFIWLLPLAVAIAVVYKALKVKQVRPVNFIKEAIVLSATILVFLFLVAAGLYAISWIITK